MSRVEAAVNQRDQAGEKALEALRKAIDAALQRVRNRPGGTAMDKAKDAGELERDLEALAATRRMPQSRHVRSAAAAFEKSDCQARNEYRASVIRIAAGLATLHRRESEEMLRQLDEEFPACVAPAAFARQLAELNSRFQDANNGNRNAKNAPIMDIRDALNRLVACAGEHRITAAELRIEMVKLVKKIAVAPRAHLSEVQKLLPEIRTKLEDLLRAAAKSARP